ncbi:MAG: preprotein translocase subunit YajC [Gammaproteobacteria bacterium]|nr:preprotein translocase subunit YajC [Gammaproteobacteria bacterium]MCH9715814.1 preprotein translocase subunit YajC [Gammaproteobacteria bacterium]MCH9763502.1 preprotein translocase subunit YajC [Gammaproteobacteria bacterium]
MSFLISDAVADTAGAAGAQGDGTFSLVMIGVIFVLFYFMLIRPQNKRAKEHRDLINKLEKGDEVATSSGILGRVVHLDEQYLKMAIAEGTEVTLQRSAVSSVLPKGTLAAL